MITISKDTWSPLARKIGKFLVKNAPQIAGYAGIGGFLVAIGLTYKNAADIHEAVETRDYKEVAKKTIPIATAAIASTVAIHYSCRESEKRLAAALLASNILSTQQEELKAAIDETVGEKKAKKIEETIQHDRIENAINASDLANIENTGHGTQLCIELETGRLFYSDASYIRSVINEVVARYNANGQVTIADIHAKLGLKEYGNFGCIGWDDYYLKGIPLDDCISVGADLSDVDQPIVTLTYRNHAVLSNAWGEDVYVKLG